MRRKYSNEETKEKGQPTEKYKKEYGKVKKWKRRNENPIKYIRRTATKQKKLE
jgi:hypothetical protein